MEKPLQQQVEKKEQQVEKGVITLFILINWIPYLFINFFLSADLIFMFIWMAFSGWLFYYYTKDFIKNLWGYFNSRRVIMLTVIFTVCYIYYQILIYGEIDLIVPWKTEFFRFKSFLSHLFIVLPILDVISIGIDKKFISPAITKDNNNIIADRYEIISKFLDLGLKPFFILAIIGFLFNKINIETNKKVNIQLIKRGDAYDFNKNEWTINKDKNRNISPADFLHQVNVELSFLDEDEILKKKTSFEIKEGERSFEKGFDVPSSVKKVKIKATNEIDLYDTEITIIEELKDNSLKEQEIYFKRSYKN